MSNPWLSLHGASAVMSAFAAKDNEYGDRCEAAATAGALIIEARAKELAPYKSGTLKRSIGHETVEKSGKAAVVAVGSDLEYAAIHEFGGTITGKPYLVFEIGGNLIFATSVTIPAQPYLRPALDETKQQVIEEVKRVFRGE